MVKHHRLGGLKQQKCIFSEFWWLEVQDEGPASVIPACRWMPSGLVLAYVPVEREGVRSQVFLLIRALILSDQGPILRPHLAVSTFLESPSLNKPHWRLGFNIWVGGRQNHSVGNKGSWSSSENNLPGPYAGKVSSNTFTTSWVDVHSCASFCSFEHPQDLTFHSTLFPSSNLVCLLKKSHQIVVDTVTRILMQRYLQN